MYPIFKNITLVLLFIATAFVLSSYILMDKSLPEIFFVHNETECNELSNGLELATSTGEFLALYTEFPPTGTAPFNVEVVSFDAMNGAPTTLSNPWASVNHPITVFTPTNTSAYDPQFKELVCLTNGNSSLFTYLDNPMSMNLINVSPNSASAPVYLNNTLFGIDVENMGTASGPVVDFDIISINTSNGLMNGIVPLQFTNNNPTFFFTTKTMSSATNEIDEIYFLSGSNLIIVTNPSVATTNFCWLDLAPNNTNNSYTQFYGLEYKSPGVLLAIRESFTSGTLAVDLVEISFNSTGCSINSITSVYDIKANLPLSPSGHYINNEFYSSTYYQCKDAYYVSTRYDFNTSSRLIEIDLPGNTHTEQIFPEYLFGIEWKHTPCPCAANFAYQQFSSCDKINFINTSTGSVPMTCYWDFGDPGSGINNTSGQCTDMHQFTTCGTYNVCLTINANGCMDNFCQTITVTDNVPPVTLCKSGVLIALDANCMASIHPSDIDNGSSDNCFLQSLNLSQTLFTSCGNYPVTLTATDWCGNTSICNTVVQVVDNSPPAIICPPDLYLSTIDPNCTMVVNGLQWLALADNCGISSVTYIVSGDTQHSGMGDASGLVFKEGVSYVTYTATDNCGNTAQCTFKVDLRCLCDCPNNIVQNPGFSNGAVVGILGSGGQSNHWTEIINPPEIYNHSFCCDPYSCGMHGYSIGNNVWGSSLYQQGLSFVTGHHYKISFCAGDPQNPFKLVFNASNSPVSWGFDPYNCTNCENMGISSVITNPNWASYTLPLWAPNQNWDVVFISGFSYNYFHSVSNIDNICIEEVNYTCCSNFDMFSANAGNIASISGDPKTEEAIINVGNLLDCNRIKYINWGDGTILDGPIAGNNEYRHTYADSVPHEIKYLIQEFDPQDSSATPCFEILLTDSIYVPRGPKTEYVNTANCFYDEYYEKMKWIAHVKCIDSGKRGAVQPKYRVQTAVMKPINWVSPLFDFVDPSGNPVYDPGGTEIVLQHDATVSNKIQSIFPATSGHEWWGLSSNEIITTSSQTPDSIVFDISFTWDGLPFGSQDSTGAFWISDDKGDLYGEFITDGFLIFQPAVVDTTTAVESELLLQNVQLFPNPAGKIITIKSGELNLADLSMEIIDCSGRTLQERNLESDILQSTIDVSMLEEGLYFIKILKSNTPIRILKFVKSR